MCKPCTLVRSSHKREKSEVYYPLGIGCAHRLEILLFDSRKCYTPCLYGRILCVIVLIDKQFGESVPARNRDEEIISVLGGFFFFYYINKWNIKVVSRRDAAARAGGGGAERYSAGVVRDSRNDCLEIPSDKFPNRPFQFYTRNRGRKLRK